MFSFVLSYISWDLNNWQTVWSSRNDQSEQEGEPSEDPLTELWTQRKIQRNRGRHLKMSTIPLCQARTYIAVLRRYNTTLDFEAPLLRVFLVDLYSAPVLGGRFKTDGVVKMSRTCWDFQGKRSQSPSDCHHLPMSRGCLRHQVRFPWSL